MWLQVYESEKEDMYYKSFPTTGIHILDDQIKLYGKEAAHKGINFDLFVNIMMSDALKKHNILELDFLQLLDNLIKDAFRAIESKQNNKGNILLIMGCVNDVLEVELYDDGDPFSIDMLKRYFDNGYSEDVADYGISDILDAINRYHASYLLTEYDNMEFTRGFSIVWNNQNRKWLNTHRCSQI